MCTRPASAMHYYLDEVRCTTGMIWEARNHWGELLAADPDKETLRKKVEELGYLRFR